jgi:hypothetical protein
LATFITHYYLHGILQTGQYLVIPISFFIPLSSSSWVIQSPCSPIVVFLRNLYHRPILQTIRPSCPAIPILSSPAIGILSSIPDRRANDLPRHCNQNMPTTQERKRFRRRSWKITKPMCQVYLFSFSKEWDNHLPKHSSVPQLQLLTERCPKFHCQRCGVTNIIIPLWLWCTWTFKEAEHEFELSMPRARRASAPPRVFFNNPTHARPHKCVHIIIWYINSAGYEGELILKTQSATPSASPHPISYGWNPYCGCSRGTQVGFA